MNKSREVLIEEILKSVKKDWLAHPNLRLGQLICCYAGKGSVFYMTDEHVLSASKRDDNKADFVETV